MLRCTLRPTKVNHVEGQSRPTQFSLVNLYLLYTRSGKAFSVAATYGHVAVAKVEKFSGEFVSCWVIGEPMPRNVITVL